MNLLISGASFAGLATAYWMTRLGHRVTIVEVAPGLRTGGTAVDIKGQTVEVVRRMGLFDAIKANRLNLARTEFLDASGVAVRSMQVHVPGEPRADDEFEIERNVLLHLMFELVRAELEVVFDDSITALTEAGDHVEVAFKRGTPRAFDLVIGCDGLHSVVRKLWFGHEAEYAHFLQVYSAVAIVDKSLIEPDTLQLFNVPGKAIMLNAYKDRTDIVLAFFAEHELEHDYRDEAQHRRIIAAQFADVGWRGPELLRELAHADNFYFDKLSQIRMPAWSRGRVVLVGDAGYCASPAAGMGGSLAIDGAAALGDAMRAHPEDLVGAFAAYEAQLRPFIDEIQAAAVQFGLEMLVPRTQEAIDARNADTGPQL